MWDGGLGAQLLGELASRASGTVTGQLPGVGGQAEAIRIVRAVPALPLLPLPTSRGKSCLTEGVRVCLLCKLLPES